MRGHVLHQHFLFAAKAAADARLDDANALDGQIQHRGQHSPDVEGNLRAGANYQPVVFVPKCEGDVRLDVRLLYFGHFVLGLEDFVGLGEALLYVADVNADFGGEIFMGVRIGKIDVFGFIMNLNCAGFHRLAHVEDGGQNLVFDLNQAEGFFGDFGGFGGHKGHPVANEAHFVVKRKAIQRPRNWVALPGGGINHARNVLPRQHGGDAGQRARFGCVNALNPSMRVRRAQHFGV